MTVNFFDKPFLLFASDLYNNKKELKRCKVLYKQSWGHSIIVINRTTQIKCISYNMQRQKFSIYFSKDGRI